MSDHSNGGVPVLFSTVRLCIDNNFNSNRRLRNTNALFILDNYVHKTKTLIHEFSIF